MWTAASTSLESLESFLQALPQTLVHDEVSLLGGGGQPTGVPAGAMPPPARGAGGRPPAGAVDAAMAGMPGMGPGGAEAGGGAPVRRDEPKVGRNDPCPCGSGKKYKKCHGK